MALDYLSCNIKTLYAVGVNSALCEPFCTGYLFCFGIENLDKISSYNLAFPFRICNSRQVGKEFLTRIYADNVESETFIVVHNITKLILTQHSMINKYTCKIVSYCTIEEHSSY